MEKLKGTHVAQASSNCYCTELYSRQKTEHTSVPRNKEGTWDKTLSFNVDVENFDTCILNGFILNVLPHNNAFAQKK